MNTVRRGDDTGVQLRRAHRTGAGSGVCVSLGGKVKWNGSLQQLSLSLCSNMHNSCMWFVIYFSHWTHCVQCVYMFVVYGFIKA